MREPVGVEAGGDREGSATSDVSSTTGDDGVLIAQIDFWRDRHDDVLDDLVTATVQNTRLDDQIVRLITERDQARAEIQRLLTQWQQTPPGDELGQVEEDRPTYGDLVNFVRSEIEAWRKVGCILAGLPVMATATERREHLIDYARERLALAGALMATKVEANDA